MCTHGETNAGYKVGVREFREQIARFLEADTPVAVTAVAKLLASTSLRPETNRAAHLSELKARRRLAEALADVNEDEIAADFKQMRRRGKMRP